MKSILTAAVFAVLFAFSTTAGAMSGDMAETVYGTVENVTEDTISVASEATEEAQIMELTINEGTQFEEETTLESFNIGDRVIVEYEGEEEQFVALSVKRIMQQAELIQE